MLFVIKFTLNHRTKAEQHVIGRDNRVPKALHTALREERVSKTPKDDMELSCCWATYRGSMVMVVVVVMVVFVMTLKIIITFVFLLWRYDPTQVMASLFLSFLDHTQQRTTVGRTPLDE